MRLTLLSDTPAVNSRSPVALRSATSGRRAEPVIAEKHKADGQR